MIFFIIIENSHNKDVQLKTPVIQSWKIVKYVLAMTQCSYSGILFHLGSGKNDKKNIK